MKRIINGLAYNTDTATLLAHFWSEFSERGADLYQTRHGAVFIIVYDDEGAGEIKPYSDAEA